MKSAILMHDSKKTPENFRRKSTDDQNNKAGLEKRFRLILLKKYSFVIYDLIVQANWNYWFSETLCEHLKLSSKLLNSCVLHQLRKKLCLVKRGVVVSNRTALQYVTFLMNFLQKSFYLRSYHARLSLWTITQHFDSVTSKRQTERWWKRFHGQIYFTFLPGWPLSPGKPKPPCSP